MIAVLVWQTPCQHCRSDRGYREVGYYRKTGVCHKDGRSSRPYRVSFRCLSCGLATTPPSVRFFGAKRHLAGVVLAVMICDCPDRLAALCGQYEVSRATARRWRRLWCGLLGGVSEWAVTVQVEAPSVAASLVVAGGHEASVLGVFGAGRSRLGWSARMMVVLHRFSGGWHWRQTSWMCWRAIREKRRLDILLDALDDY